METESWKDKIKGNWNQLKGRMKKTYGTLTDDDMIYSEGQEDELIGKLQEKLGKTKEEIIDWINDFELV